MHYFAANKRTGNQERLIESYHSRSRKILSNYVAHLFHFIDEVQKSNFYISFFQLLVIKPLLLLHITLLNGYRSVISVVI